MKISLKARLEHVANDTQYKGYLKFGENTLTYNLEFLVPIYELSSLKPLESASEMRNRFKLTIKKKDIVVLLDDSEYDFFLQIIMQLAKELNKVQFVGAIVSETVKRIDDFQQQTKEAISTELEGIHDFPNDLLDVLRQKFECVF